MISKIIEFSVRNRWLVLLLWVGVAIWGVYAVLHTPVDAIPDLSENQVIVFADWMGRSPQDIEEQVTYPLSVQLQGLAGVKTIRSSSEPNFSMINIIFDSGIDPYFARTRVLERLTTAKQNLPADVTPAMAPDATALGQIFWYTVEGPGHSIDELRAIQDFTVRYQLNSIPGVAEVASVGGFVRQYQVDVDPNKLRTTGLPLSAVYSAIASSNASVGGKVLTTPNSEYLLRGVGWLKGVADLEEVVVTSRAGVPIRIKDIGSVQLGPEFRRSALEKNGEAVGGVVMMRIGENPLQVTQAIKERIREIQPGLPAGVRIVPFYDRTRLIESAIHTVTGTLREEMIIASIAILLILTHIRSAIVVCLTLPMAVLVSFLFMYYLGIPSNIMSLSGIAISIGILVDASVVMVENASHELREHFNSAPLARGQRPRGASAHPVVSGDTTEIVIRACRLVGRPIFFSVLIMLLSFLPVFAFGGQEGKLSHPLAFTKSFAMIGVAILAITFVPALIPILIKGRIKSEEENWIVRSFIHMYRPVITWIIDRPGVVWWMMGVILILGAGLVGASFVSAVVLAGALVCVALSIRRWRWLAAAVASLLVIAFIADTRFRKLGSEFMPELDEGSIMDMPITAPHVPMAQAIDDVQVRDRLLRSFPEVDQAVGKIGRAETATDPSPVDMVETIVSMRPRELWPKRTVRTNDLHEHARAVAQQMEQRGWLKRDAANGDELLHTAIEITASEFDRSMRELARRRQVEYEPVLAEELSTFILDDVLKHMSDTGSASADRLLRTPGGDERIAIVRALHDQALLLALPRQEQLDQLLTTLRKQLVDLKIIPDRDDLFLDRPNLASRTLNQLRASLGQHIPSYPERLFAAVESHREALWRQRMKTLNWELFDYAKVAVNDYLVDALLRTARGTPAFVADPAPEPLKQLKQQLAQRFQKNYFLWTKTKQDIVAEMDRELQMPGWGNIWTQPIINRVNMLATGVRTQIGVKVFGPTGRSLTDSIADIQRISQAIAARLKTIAGAADVVADQATGKRYIEIEINREQAARYGVNVADLSQIVEAAIGGATVTTTVEGRQRFSVQLRYSRDTRDDVDALKDILVPVNTTPASLNASPAPSLGKIPGAGQQNAAADAMGAAPMSSGTPTLKSEISNFNSESSLTMIPLSSVAVIRTVDGPSMIKSENGRLRNYVTLNVRGRDIVGFVEEAQQAIKPIEASLAGTGMTLAWAGEFENQLRARQTLGVIFPMVITLILLLLYITFKDILDTLLVALAVLGALAGSVMFQSLFGFNFSVIVSIGYIAAFGMATQTGVIMLVYLRESIAKRGGLAGIRSVEELRQAVIEGAVHRLRPKLLTEGVAIVGLVPMLWATGTGAEIMRPMAAPVLGGLLISDEVIDIMIPVLFYWIRRRRWLKMRAQSETAGAPVERELALS
ncbi:MAG TPA: efflux RND transporter permease subunit, partial [Tepidisphaeraceae bacterium]